MKQINPRFEIWLKATGQTIDSDYKLYEYMIWVSQHAVAFKKINRLHAYDDISKLPDGHDHFTDYLSWQSEK